MEVLVLEWIGWFSLIILLCYSSYPSKVKTLENKVKKLEFKLRGDNYKMSKIINELKGKRCNIETDEIIINETFNCTILDTDDEWIKFTYTDKKNNLITKILRIEEINSIELMNE